MPLHGAHCRSDVGVPPGFLRNGVLPVQQVVLLHGQGVGLLLFLQAQIRKEEQELSQAKKELAALYGETRIVPAQYRRVDALQYIYDMISTSDYDVRQAIEYFDKSQQRALEEMRLQEQQQANALAMEQNDLLDRQNSIAEKARRDANIAAAVGAVQRHNTNKTIKKWMEK